MTMLPASGQLRRPIRIVTFVTCVILAVLASMSRKVKGQGRPVALEIAAPKDIQIAVGAETALPIAVLPVEAVPRQAMLLLRGLPPAVALSVGRVFDSGVWCLRIADLPALRIMAPSNVVARGDLVLSVVTLDGATIVESRSSFVFTGATSMAAIQPPRQPTAWAQAVTSPGGTLGGSLTALAPSAPPSAKTIAEMDNLTALMRRGDESMALGKVNDARLFYARAAENGWAPAALALARTYDVQELAKVAVLGGVHANPDMADKWYKRARDLGSQEAARRLQYSGKNETRTYTGSH